MSLKKEICCLEGPLYMEDTNELVKGIKNWGYRFNARKQFNDFLASINDDEKLLSECKKIYGLIDAIVLDREKSQFEETLPVGNYYRARIINLEHIKSLDFGIGKNEDGRLHGYNEDNSREPIIGKSSSGRNNIEGSSYLYVASNEETACVEVKPQYGDLISLATFKSVKNMKIINFSTEKSFSRTDTEIQNMSMGVFFTLLMMQYCVPIKDKNIYRVTQIISDYLRKTGIDGIAYRSFFSPGGVNYTLFNCHHSNIEYVDSRILLYKQAMHSFWDYNNGKAIMSCLDKKLEYDSEIAKKQIDGLNLINESDL